MGAKSLSLSRRAALGLLSAGVFVIRATPQKRKSNMAPAQPSDLERLQRYYDTSTKYYPAPVPAPLDRSTAIAFVNSKANPATPPEKMRKLTRLAIFYELRETAAAFIGVLTGAESQPDAIVRSALALIALAWIGDQGQQARAQEYYRGLQSRASVDLHRDIMLEVVEAFGPREGTGSHRQWIQAAIRTLEAQLKQDQANRNVAGANLAEEKINALTEYLNFQLARVDRSFSLRQMIESLAPSAQIAQLVPLALGTSPEATPQLGFWASMRLIRMAQAFRDQIGATFLSQAPLLAAPAQELFRARALRAAEFFGRPPAAPDVQWLAGHPDTRVDPLVLRPGL
jgi:hypothetical protein